MSRRAHTQEAKDSRKMDLIQAALALYKRKEFVLPAVQEIVSEAKLAKGTFYLYFDSKEEIFLEILEMGFSQWMNAVQTVLSFEVFQDPVRLADAIVSPIIGEHAFLQLASMTQSILEQNLKKERAALFKNRLGQAMEQMAYVAAQRFSLKAPDLIEIMLDCYAAIIGTWQITQVSESIAAVRNDIPYPFLFQKFEDRVRHMLTLLILGRYGRPIQSLRNQGP